MKIIQKISAVCFFIIFSLSCFSQSYELGKVTVAELEEKEHPTEKDAEAAVLFDVGRTYFSYDMNNGFQMITEVTSKVKIYKKEGYSFGDVEIPIYIGGTERESVVFSKAYTYNLEKGKIEKTKLKSDGEFLEKTNKYWSKVKISMPNVREGSIIEYKYVLTSPFFSNLPEWYFQKSIPVKYSKFETVIPEYYYYTPRTKGYILPKVTSTSKTTTFHYTDKEKVGNSHFQKTSYSNEQFSYKETITTYVSENVPLLKKEDYVGNVKNYTASVNHELTSTNFPNNPIKSYSTSWEDVCKTIYDSENFGAEVKKTGYFEKELDFVLQGKNTRDEKIIAILDFVKKQVKWNDFNGIYCDDGVRSAYKNKTGNVAEINLMLVSMLRYAGLEANPILVSTLANGIPLYPSRTSFNYVVAAVEIPDNLILLDATDKNSYLNVLPSRVLNWNGRLIRKDGSSTFVNLLPKLISKENTIGLLSIEADGSVKGKIRMQHYDYNAFRFRSRFLNLTKETYLEALEKKLSSIEIEEHITSNESDLSKPINEEFQFSHNGLTEIIGDKIYFTPLLFYAMSENPFKADTREYPIDFTFPHEDKYTLTYSIPEGYVVEYLPKSLVLSTGDNLLNYKFNAQAVGNKVQLSVSFNINESIIMPDKYLDLKDFFKRVVE
ncbi:MAG: transglutaminase, partial [Bacteroidetes bacterium HGW-Bacteroidetes-23]